VTLISLSLVIAPENWRSIVAGLADYLPPPVVVWGMATVWGLAVTIAIAQGARAVWRSRLGERRRATLEDILTIVAACIATAVSAQGMWRFTGDVLGLDGPLRVLLFAFIEVAIVTSAVRARRNMRENYTAGIDGIAVWVLTALTSVLSSMDARSLAEAAFRLAAPLVAAWLWERSMRLERHRLRGTTGIHWRFTLDRILVRLGLAEASDRTASEVDAHRRITRVAKAAKRVRRLAGGKPRKLARAEAAFDRALDALMEHTNLIADEQLQRRLLDQVSTWIGGDQLTRLHAVPVWSRTAHPAVPLSVTPDDAQAAVDQIARWTSAEAQQHILDRTAAMMLARGDDPMASLAAAVTASVNGGVRTPVVTPPVTETVAELADASPAVSPAVTPSVTAFVTAPPVTNVVTLDVTDRGAYDLDAQLSANPYVTAPVTPAVTAPAVTPPVTPSPADEADKSTKKQLMTAFWAGEVAQGRYPKVKELADHAGAHHSQASALREQLVKELPWWQRRKADPKRASA
jgi:hypothetical protein